jgi:hypothetical protein
MDNDHGQCGKIWCQLQTNKCQVCMSVRKKSCLIILLHVTWEASLFRGSLLGSSSVTCNNTTGVARQPPHVTMET